MDAFQELGITAPSEAPQPRTAARTLRELATVVAAGTAVTFGVLVALVVVAIVAVTIVVGVKAQETPTSPGCSPVLGCLP